MIIKVSINKYPSKFSTTITQITKDKNFSLNKVQCLGACVNGPVLKINENYFEDLTVKLLENLIIDLKNNKKLKKGPQSGRKASEPFKF